MTGTMNERFGRFRQGLRHAFAVEGPDGPLSAEDHDLLRRLAAAIAARKMVAPAILFLSSVRPMSSLGSQALVFLRPFLAGLFREADYDRMTRILDRREGIAALVEAVEAAGRDGRK